MQLHEDSENPKPSSEAAAGTTAFGATIADPPRRRVLLPRESPEAFGSGMQLHEDLMPLWDMAARVAVNGTILVVVSNAGYMDMLENWVRHVSNAGLGAHFILFAEDEETLRFGQTRWPGQTIHLALPDQSLSATWQASSEALFPHSPHSPHSATRAGTLSFHLLASRRILYLLHLLSFGFNLLYSDTDVAILRNPLPEITADPKQTFDMALTLDGYESNWQKKAVQVESYGVAKLADRKLSVSSSLLFLRPTSGAKCLVGDWANRLMKLGRDEGTEQEHLNALIVEMDKYGLLPRIAVLPAQKFLSGQLLLEDDWATVEALKGELVTVHAGGLMGKDAKRYALNKIGFWIAESDAAAAAGGEGESGGEATGGGESGEAAAAGGGERRGEAAAGAGSNSEPASSSNEDSKWPSTIETSTLSNSSSSSGLGAGDKGPFCVGLLCPEMHVSQEEVVLLSVQPWVQRHVQQMDPLVPMVASADRFVIVTTACKGKNSTVGALEEVVLLSVQPWVQRHVEKLDSLVPMVASAERFVIVTVACQGKSRTMSVLGGAGGGGAAVRAAVDAAAYREVGFPGQYLGQVSVCFCVCVGLLCPESSFEAPHNRGPFCVGLLCPEMHASQEEVVLLSVQPWVQRHVEKMDPLVPMVASADRFVIVTAACKGKNSTVGALEGGAAVRAAVGAESCAADGCSCSHGGLSRPLCHRHCGVQRYKWVCGCVEGWVFRWVQRHVQQIDPLVPMVASADRFVIVTAACKVPHLPSPLSTFYSSLCPSLFTPATTRSNPSLHQMVQYHALCCHAPPPIMLPSSLTLYPPLRLPSPVCYLPGQVPLFTNWFNAMHSAAMAGHVIASVPQEVEGTSQGLLRQPGESESPYKAALTCLLLPSLLMERVLKLGYNVIYRPSPVPPSRYLTSTACHPIAPPHLPPIPHFLPPTNSDISSVWLQDPLPFLPPEFNAVLPSSVPSSSQAPPSTSNKIDGKLKRTLPISRSDLGYFSPWFVALRPSRPILLMLKEWALLALEDFRERTAAAHRNSLAHSLSASESLKVGLNEAITRMVEEGEPGSNVGVLSRWLFPPVWKVMGEREWFAKHREEVVAVPNDCGDDVSHREMCFRDLKLWV
ncbi:unnamed protein product [Closterium sp. Yama58-4]|nr:unnamed protein product [Closterium sp. Yama58-4]